MGYWAKRKLAGITTLEGINDGCSIVALSYGKLDWVA